MAETVAGVDNIELARGQQQAAAPDDFESEEQFLQFVRDRMSEGISADRENREQALEDLRFFSGDQWPEDIRSKRKKAKKPTLTINRLPAFVQTFIANRRLNEVGIDVHPDAGGDKGVAKLRKELIRSIQKHSKADRVYDKAFENNVICGIGNFQVVIDYAHDDVFVQDLEIRSIANPLAVVWDPSATDLTGRDAGWVIVTDKVSKDSFQTMWPDARAGLPTNDTRLLGLNLKEENLTINDDSVDVAAFWRMRSEPRIMAMMGDGSVEDVTDKDQRIWLPQVMQKPNGDPMIRETMRSYAEMHLVTATDILQGPYRLWIKRPPVFSAKGWEINVGDYRRRFGLVRFLRDPQILHNYWRTVIAEKLMGAPKNKWVAPSTAVEGREREWRESHLSEDPLLVYNAESGQAPTRVGPPPMEDALTQEAALSAQDIKDVSNIHEASLGQESNEVSGKGILARQRVGEAGLVIYNENTNDAIEEAGAVLNDLIPTVYDTPRVIKVLGEDANDFELKTINGFSEDSVDITFGKYVTTITTGPSYATRRIEAAESMLNMVNAMPDTMAVAADQIVEAQDWPMADKIAARLRMMLPPGVVNTEDMSDQQRQRMEAQAQTQQEQRDLDQAKQQAETRTEQARAVEAVARARQALGQAAKAFTEASLAEDKAMSDISSQQMNSIAQAISALDNLMSEGGNNGDG